MVAGGLVPPKMRGRKLSGLSAVWDWYGTFAHLARQDPADREAAAAGLPPIDSINLWPWLSGENATSPRRHLAIGSSRCVKETEGCVNQWGWGNVPTIVQGLIEDRGADGRWKLLLGAVPMNGWQGPFYPNSSTTAHAFGFSGEWVLDCGAGGCLFRLDLDPEERHDVAHANPQLVVQMKATLLRLQSTALSPDRGPGEQNGDVAAACAAAERYGGFFGPFHNV